MKKILFIIFLSIFIFSCSGGNQKIEEAKKDLLQNKSNLVKTKNADDILKKEKSKQKETNNNIKIKYLTEEKFIEINPINESKLKTGEVEITGKTLSYVDKIEVNFINNASDFPEDNYTLKKFKAGGDYFKYIASSRFRVLDFGENIYTFKAYSGDKVSILQLTIYLEEPKDEVDLESENIKEEQNFESKLIGTENDTVFLNLPVSDDFGKPIMLGEDIFTYSLIDELKIRKKNTGELTCENLTEFLKENINSWFYWNTCRDIVKDKGISFYVIELKGENYIYEKHYVDFIHGFYGVQGLEKGQGVTSDTIKEKNDELKEKNENYTILEKTDLLFKKIVNN